jgi:hypothetical protein
LEDATAVRSFLATLCDVNDTLAVEYLVVTALVLRPDVGTPSAL